MSIVSLSQFYKRAALILAEVAYETHVAGLVLTAAVGQHFAEVAHLICAFEKEGAWTDRTQ